MTHVSSPALFVGGEGRAPDAPRGGKLGAVPVRNVANTLGGQGVANVASFAVTLDEAPGFHEVVHHLADSSLGDAEPGRQVLTGDHRVVGDEVECPLLRGCDAEGRRSLHHPLRAGYGGAFALRRLGARPSAGAALGADVIEGVVRASEQPRGLLPEAKVLPFERIPRLHGDVGVPEIDALAEPPRQPLLPHAGNQDQDGVGAAGVVVLGYGPQPVVEGAPAQGQALAHHAEAAAVVERDRGIEAAPAVELHVRTEPVDPGGQ